MKLKQMGLFLTPEEIDPPEDICYFRNIIQEESTKSESYIQSVKGLQLVALDPYVNALHGLLLSREVEDSMSDVENLVNQVLKTDISKIDKSMKFAVLNSPKAIARLHEQVWSDPDQNLHLSWRQALQEFNRRNLIVQDA